MTIKMQFVTLEFGLFSLCRWRHLFVALFLLLFVIGGQGSGDTGRSSPITDYVDQNDPNEPMQIIDPYDHQHVNIVLLKLISGPNQNKPKPDSEVVVNQRVIPSNSSSPNQTIPQDSTGQVNLQISNHNNETNNLLAKMFSKLQVPLKNTRMNKQISFGIMFMTGVVFVYRVVSTDIFDQFDWDPTNDQLQAIPTTNTSSTVPNKPEFLANLTQNSTVLIGLILCCIGLSIGILVLLRWSKLSAKTKSKLEAVDNGYGQESEIIPNSSPPPPLPLAPPVPPPVPPPQPKLSLKKSMKMSQVSSMVDSKMSESKFMSSDDDIDKEDKINSRVISALANTTMERLLAKFGKNFGIKFQNKTNSQIQSVNSTIPSQTSNLGSTIRKSRDGAGKVANRLFKPYGREPSTFNPMQGKLPPVAPVVSSFPLLASPTFRSAAPTTVSKIPGLALSSLIKPPPPQSIHPVLVPPTSTIGSKQPIGSKMLKKDKEKGFITGLLLSGLSNLFGERNRKQRDSVVLPSGGGLSPKKPSLKPKKRHNRKRGRGGRKGRGPNNHRIKNVKKICDQDEFPLVVDKMDRMDVVLNNKSTVVKSCVVSEKKFVSLNKVHEKYDREKRLIKTIVTSANKNNKEQQL